MTDLRGVSLAKGFIRISVLPLVVTHRCFL